MKRLFGFLAVLMVMSLVLGACGTPATETPAVDAPVTEPPAEEAPAEEAPGEEAPVAAEKTVLNVWSFTNEILTMQLPLRKHTRMWMWSTP